MHSGSSNDAARQNKKNFMKKCKIKKNKNLAIVTRGRNCFSIQRVIFINYYFNTSVEYEFTAPDGTTKRQVSLLF